jgi:hypothetical protein
MGILDRLLGRTTEPAIASAGPAPPARSSDPAELAVERYRYLLRTAPPEELERAHAEAFERLTAEQRSLARRDLEAAVPASEAPRTDDPQDLARAATRAELRQPGTLERTFGAGRVPGMGGSFLETFAAVFVATSVAQLLFGSFGDPFTDPAAPGAGQAEAAVGSEAASDADGIGWEGGSEVGGADVGDAGADIGGDFGGDIGDFGGFDI